MDEHGYVHFRLSDGVYHHAPVHQLFVVDIVVSAFLAPAVFVPRRVYAAAAGASVAAALAALALSRSAIGLPVSLHVRWMERGLAPAGQTVLGVSDTLLVATSEIVAVLACAALALSRPPADTAAGTSTTT